MTHVNQPIRRFKSKLPISAMMFVIGAIAVLGNTRSAGAQFGPPMPCMINPCLCPGTVGGCSSPSSTSTSTSSSGTYTSIAVFGIDSPENRAFADQVYEAVFQRFEDIRKTQGLNAAIAFSQSPRLIPELTPLIGHANEKQYLLSVYILAAAMADAPTYLTRAGNKELPLMSDAHWNSGTSQAQKLYDMKASDISMTAFLERSYRVPDRFGPTTRKAAAIIIATKRADDDATARAAAERKAAEAAAEAARQEQARIAALKAVEEARIAAEKKAAADAVMRAQEKAAYDEAIAKLTEYLGLGPIPERCIRKYSAPDMSSVTIVVDLETTKRSIVYLSPPTITPDEKEAFGKNWQKSSHNPIGVKPLGARVEIAMNESHPPGPFYIGIPKSQSDRRYIAIEDFNSMSASTMNIAVDALQFCTVRRTF